MYVIKNELDHFPDIQIFLSKRSVPDPVQLVQIQIRPSQKVPSPTGSTTLQNGANIEIKIFLFALQNAAYFEHICLSSMKLTELSKEGSGNYIRNKKGTGSWHRFERCGN